ncbi:MAG: formate dehydrogenase accessory protein FdhE [Pseudorhodoplanes sp.]|jgi:FdhE protein|nr:formate dehydrogenase accessory protein FdhE [Pseudorhodoplanes sp.]
MSRVETPEADPSAVGTIPKPPFVRLSDPVELFAARAGRFRALAEGHDLAPYLHFLAELCEAQATMQDGLAEPEAIDAEVLARAHEHAMPPLDRGRFAVDTVFAATFDRLLAAAEQMNMPPQAAAARDRVKLMDAALREEMVHNVLAESIPVETLAEHIFVAAALQVHFARLAARLDPKTLVSVGDSLCPSCGGAPSSTVIVRWSVPEGARYCSCSLCGTLWNHLRSKCTLCGATKQILFQEIEGSGGTVKAETCDDCRGYMKVLYQTKNDALDPVADDVATLGLDLLVRELGFRRGGVNPFLIGY